METTEKQNQKTESEKRQKLPCEQQCPMCGSATVLNRIVFKGEYAKFSDSVEILLGKRKPYWIPLYVDGKHSGNAMQNSSTNIAPKTMIICHCQACGFNYAVNTLNDFVPATI